jgi:hypothetical protein
MNTKLASGWPQLLLPDLFSSVEIVLGGRVFIASIDAGISESNDF